MERRRPKTGAHPSTKAAIREAAIALFAEKGFTATSTREICQRAGITKPVLYYHFGSKEQLYVELILDCLNEYRKEMLRASRQGSTARERLAEVVAAIFRQTRRNPGTTRMAFRMMFAPEKESPATNYLEAGEVELRLLEGIIRDGIKRGELKGRPVEIAEALMGIHTLYTMSFLLTGRPDLGRPLARRAVDLLVKGCRGDSNHR
jgi:AcrR family transcriptional regulator